MRGGAQGGFKLGVVWFVRSLLGLCGTKLGNGIFKVKHRWSKRSDINKLVSGFGSAAFGGHKGRRLTVTGAW